MLRLLTSLKAFYEIKHENGFARSTRYKGSFLRCVFMMLVITTSEALLWSNKSLDNDDVQKLKSEASVGEIKQLSIITR